jgi:hypothetical protein
VDMIGLVFGFMRPVPLDQDRRASRNMAMTIAKLMARGFSECYP